MMRSIVQDLRYALRQLRNAPGFTCTAIAVLALGLGANVAVFTVLSGILLRPLPYAQSDRIVQLQLSGPLPFWGMSYANMAQLRDAAGSTVPMGMTLRGTSASVVAPAGRFQLNFNTVTANLFDVLGVQPILGRAFRTEENEPGRADVLLLSEEAWRRLYDSDRNVLGSKLMLHNHEYTIIGIMPKGFSMPFGDAMQVWAPEPLDSAARTKLTGEHVVWGSTFARLPANMKEAQLSDRLGRAQAIIAKEAPANEVYSRVKVINYQKTLNERVRRPLLLLYTVVLGIWALACLNVTSLSLVRAVSRAREHAVRAALGASRMRLLQQSTIEALMLSLLGSAAGLLLGEAVIRVLWHEIKKNLPMTSAIQMDWRVILGVGAFTLAGAVAVGLVPALRVMRHDVRESLHGAKTTATGAESRAREALVAAQLALTLVFLVGAGLFLRTIHALRQVPLGFAQQNVLTGGISLGQTGELDETQPSSARNIVTTTYLPLLQRLRAIPGAQVVALSSVLPMRPEFMVNITATLDHKQLPYAQQPQGYGRLASPGLVEALGIPMKRGRFFTEDDTAASPVVIVINQAFADKYLPGQNPIGHTLSMGKGRFDDMRIVGVIGDMKQVDVTMPTKPELYFCLAQTQPGTPLYGIATAFIQVAIRAAVPADTLRVQFDKALHEVAPDATTTEVKTIHEAVEDSFGSETLMARLLEAFAALALIIACVGLYGLLSFAVAQRTREIGVRLALGAPQRGIVTLVLRRALRLVLIGLAAGSVMAWFAARLADSYVFGVKPHDAFTFSAVALLLAAASLLAAWLPARRAAAVDPIQALRSE